MSVTNGERLATKQDLADMYQGILPYLGGMPEMLANKFSKGDLYSTEEKMIGQWIDGKPLYQRVFDFGALPNKSKKDVLHNISDIDVVVSAIGIAYGANTNFYPIPYTSPDSLGDNILMTVSTTYVRIMTGYNRSNLTNCYIVLQYTKTTDSPISIGDDTDYSTEEKIVGTWIDGSPVYQKVVYNTTLATIPNNSWVQYCSITNLKAVISFSLIRANSDGTPSNGVFNDISGSTDGNSVKCIARASTLTLDNSKSYAIIQYLKTT